MTDLMTDHAEIVNVLGRYVELIDSGRYDDLVECFTPEARADYAGVDLEPGVDAIIAHVARLRAFRTCQHLLFPVTVRVDGDEASALVYGTAVLIDDGSEATTRGLSYEHRLVRTASGWRISQLVQRALWAIKAPAVLEPGSPFSSSGPGR